jgi:hypothetical protein
MSYNSEQYGNQTQAAARSFQEVFQGLAETHIHVFRQLGARQQDMVKQAAEAINEQVQLVSRVRDPREFASAQANLVIRHGQRYAESLQQTVDIVAEAYQAYGNRLDTTTDKARQIA